MNIHIGTYDGNIISFNGRVESLQVLNSFKASENSIRCLHRTGRYLLAGGFDEIIRIYDMKTNKQVGELEAEQGTITEIGSHSNIVVTSGSEGTIKLWKMKDWDELMTLKEHKKHVESFSIHRSGKMMVSVGKDRKLIVWNLLKAMRVFDKKLDYDVNKVLIVEDCSSIFLLTDTSIRVLETENNTQIKQVTFTDKIQDGIFYKSYLIISTESGLIKIYDTDKVEKCLSFKAHEARTKKIAVCEDPTIGDALVSVSSTGEIKIWDILLRLEEIGEIKEDKEMADIEPLNMINTQQRIISLECYTQSITERPAAAAAAPQIQEKVEQEDQVVEEVQLEERPPQKVKKNKHIQKQAKFLQGPKRLNAPVAIRANNNREYLQLKKQKKQFKKRN